MSPSGGAINCVWWNLQRLFRPGGSRIARDLDVTEEGGWTKAAYERKVRNVAAVLRESSPEAPGLLCLCEVQNRKVAEDVVKEAGWQSQMVYAEDPSERIDGADVVLLYSKRHFASAGATRSHNVHNRFATRDILEVPLKTHSGDELLVLCNHWPSRLYPRSEPLRIGLADYCWHLFASRVRYPKEALFTVEGRPKLPSRSALEARWLQRVLIVGDFNDSPWDVSVEQVLDSTRARDQVTASPRFPRGKGRSAIGSYLNLRPRLYNPGWRLLTATEGPTGSCTWQGGWYLFDQALFSAGLLGEKGLRYLEGSLSLLAPRTVECDGGKPIEVLTRAGAPKPYDAKTRNGVSDHLPLTFQLTVD